MRGSYLKVQILNQITNRYEINCLISYSYFDFTHAPHPPAFVKSKYSYDIRLVYFTPIYN